MSASAERLPNESELNFVGQVPLEQPYPGLRAFESSEASLFFGRDSHVDQCIARLQSSRFLAVVGSSGAGKSSLVRAGLLPALSLGLMRGADENWELKVFRPGADPIAALVEVLESLPKRPDAAPRDVASPGAAAPAPGDSLGPAANVADLLRESAVGLVEAVAQSGLGQTNLLLVVDQFEELFRLGREQQTPARWDTERALFIRRILEARHQTAVPIFVVITMRTDFLEDCTRYFDLPEALNESQFLVPRLTREQLEEAVVQPVQGRINWMLKRQLLSDAIGVTDDPEGKLSKETKRRQRAIELPVVQHALMRTWQCWLQKVNRQTKQRDAELGLDDYEDAGTVERALNEHAEEVFEQLGNDEKRAAEVVFRRITLVGSDGRATRSPATLESIQAVAAAVGIPAAEASVRRAIEAFRSRDVSFLMPPAHEPLRPQTEVDISHEALLRTWKRLQEWAKAEHEQAATYVDLAALARQQEDGSGQLLSGRRLILSDEWLASSRPTVAWARRYHTLDSVAQGLLDEDRAKGSRPESLAARAKREAETRRDLDAWHEEQLHRVQKYVTESRSVRDIAEEAEKERQAAEQKAHDERDAAEARVKRFKLLSFGLAGGILVVVGVSALIVSQRQTITTQGGTIIRYVEELKHALQVAADKTVLAEASAAAANDARNKALVAKADAEMERGKADKQRLLAEQAVVDKEKQRVLTAQALAKESDARAALLAKSTVLEATNLKLREQNDVLDQKLAASALSDQERARLQQELIQCRQSCAAQASPAEKR